MADGTQAPELEDLLRAAVRAGTAKIHTSFPATIVVYDAAKQAATVQPALRARVDDVLLDQEHPDLTPMPQLSGVPVVWPSGATWSLHAPLAPGDPVTVVVAERSTDEWRALGAVDNAPLDARRFDLSDAVCFPGGRATNPAAVPTSAPLPATAVDVAALMVRGAQVKLGSTAPAAIHPLMLSTPFLAALDVFLTSVALDTIDSPATAAAATVFQNALLATPHTSLVVKTE